MKRWTLPMLIALAIGATALLTRGPGTAEEKKGSNPFSSTTIDLGVVVSDVEMPRLNGFDLTRQIKAKFGLPVILVTGKEKEEHRREGLEAGADAYIVKSSFDQDHLLRAIAELI